MPGTGRVSYSQRDETDFQRGNKQIARSLLGIVLPTLRSPLDKRVAFQHFTEVLAPRVLISGK